MNHPPADFTGRPPQGKRRNTVIRTPALLASIILSLSSLSLAADYEIPPILEAKDFLPADMLKGENHEVMPQVTNDGYMNHYTIVSDFGTFKAKSTRMARRRIHEVGGIKTLKDVSQTEAFADALAASATKTLKSAGKIVADPVGSVKGISSGVGRMFKRMALKGEKVVDKAEEIIDKQGDEEEGGGGEEKVDKAVDAGKDLVGVNKAKRRLAKRAGVDPYSTNKVLQEELDRLSWAAFGGGFALDQAMSGIPLTGEVTQVSDMVWESTPADLEVTGREKLAKMGVTKEKIDAFYKAPHLTTTSRAAIVTLLEKMQGVEGLPVVVRLSLKLQGEEEAGFFVASCVLLGKYHETQGPLKEILAGPVMPRGAKSDGTLVLAFALDYLVWTKDIAAAATKIDGNLKGDASLERIEFWVAGYLSSRSKDEIAALGWAVHEKAAEELGVQLPR
jgi:hypothetical protein